MKLTLPWTKKDNSPGRNRRSQGRPFWQLGLWTALLLALGGLHVLLFPPSHAVPSVQLEVGSITEQDVSAPFTFRAPRPRQELEASRYDAAQRVEPVYRRVADAVEHAQLRRDELFGHVTALTALDSLSVGERLQQLQREVPALQEETLRQLLNPDVSESIRVSVDKVMAQVGSLGILDGTPQGTYQQIRVIDPSGGEAVVETSDVVLPQRLDPLIREEGKSKGASQATADAVLAISRYLLVPNLTYDFPETEARKSTAAAEVPEDREYARGERIVDAGVRVTRDHLSILGALEQERLRRALAQDQTIALRLLAGRVALLLLVVGMLVILLRQQEPTFFGGWQRATLLTLLLAFFLGASALAIRTPALGLVAVPVPMLAMLSTILFRAGVGARVTVAGILLLAMVPGQASPMVVIWIAVGAASVIAVRRVRNRNQFYRAVGVISAVYAIGLAGLYMSEPGAAGATLRQVLVGLASGVTSTAVTLFLLPLFEAMFAVTTDLTLLELSDLNHPLLKRMSLESPGTYHHSQVVGTLAEAGTAAIGANSLLSRVGANFHDIGKMLKPRYYVENQSDDNAHDELSPSMSALVIAAHVKDGIELGRQWGLPQNVTDFIPEHHGTSVMQYFYQKALDKEDGGTINVEDFRYPGPKPQTRESAVVMLADGVEASTRSLSRPTPSRIREMVKKIFDKRMSEGQLEECGLTLADLATVRETFIPILVGIHHHRVPYPGQREHENQKEQERIATRSRGKRSAPSVASRS